MIPTQNYPTYLGMQCIKLFQYHIAVLLATHDISLTTESKL